MPEEVKPAVIEVLAEFEAIPVPTLRTGDAEQEFLEVIKMEEEFKNYLSGLLKDRLEGDNKVRQEVHVSSVSGRVSSGSIWSSDILRPPTNNYPAIFNM